MRQVQRKSITPGDKQTNGLEEYAGRHDLAGEASGRNFLLRVILHTQRTDEKP
jgi:hypothetical protein